MLEEIVKEQREIQVDSIGRLLELTYFLTNSKPEQVDRIEENCFIDISKNSLEQSRLIHDLIINLSEVIKGGN